jgi:hypothetical protein
VSPFIADIALTRESVLDIYAPRTQPSWAEDPLAAEARLLPMGELD